MKTPLSIIIASIIIAASTLHAQTVTITLPNNLTAAQQTDTISVLAGESLEVLAFLANRPDWQFNVNGVNFSQFTPRDLQTVVIAGPATLYARTDSDGLIFTYRKTVIASIATQNVPSQTVAIPENTIAPADVILESSTDLMTWLSAFPGSFAPSELKRFFRLRLVLH